MLKRNPDHPEYGSIIGSTPLSPFGYYPGGYDTAGRFHGVYNYLELGFLDEEQARGGYPNALFQFRQANLAAASVPAKSSRMLLAFKFSENPLDTGPPRKIVNGVEYEFVDIAGYKFWREVNPFAPRSQGGQLTAPTQSMPAWLEEFAGPYPLGPTTSPTPTPAWLEEFAGPYTLRPSRSPSPTIVPEETAPPPPSSPGPDPSVPPTVPDSGYSIPPPPPIRGSTSDVLYFRPGWSQISETGRQEAQNASPDLHKVYSGLIASPLAVLEEYLVRPILNVPHSALNKVTTAGQHLDRSSQWLQQDEWGEASAEGLEAVADLALAFLDVTAIVDAFGSYRTPPGVRRPALRGSLPEEIPAGVEQEYASDLSGVSGKGAAARNRAIDSAIEQYLPDLELTYRPRYNPWIRTALALKGRGVQIGKNRFSSFLDLIDAIVHEELHHRWYDRSLPEPHHPRIAADIRDWDFFHYTVGRYLRLRGWRTLEEVPLNSERRALERGAEGRR